MFTSTLALFSLGLLTTSVSAFDLSKKDNLAVYWGQDGAGNQQSLSYYCEDDTIDMIPIAFLYDFWGPGDLPEIDLSNICGSWNPFPGTSLANCQSMADDIKTCQAKGKAVTISLGGATGVVGFSSDSAAEALADRVWNLFLGGSSSTRPFGDAVLDGVDLDIESGTPAHYAAFVNRIKSHADGASKQYYVTAAPQCPYPDAYIGAALNEAPFDAVFVQFYNNYCGLNAPSEYNMATWDNWAKTESANKDVKVYIGAPGSAASAGSGYVNSATLAGFAKEAQEKYSSFGGVMLWDASTAHTNNRFDSQVKNAITASAQSRRRDVDADDYTPSSNSRVFRF
ncbi:glycoside hydrolase family 18 protein [Gelatoporia subvermispora B]|uniref:chitinase n=1 Tax=Ceriporiopsis subvermispora (strain B) TaxID=914234 RepID=M2QZS8_CERS8|nr:glycoside hydrolase family 18 protein [Gelatoporia subvermispora B]